MRKDVREQRFPTKQEILDKFPSADRVGLFNLCDAGDIDATSTISSELGPIMYVFDKHGTELGYYVEYFIRPTEISRDWHPYFTKALIFYNLEEI